MHLTHQNLSARALFCLNSLAKVNTHFLIYKYAEAIYTVCAVAILELKQGLGVQTTLNLKLNSYSIASVFISLCRMRISVF